MREVMRTWGGRLVLVMCLLGLAGCAPGFAERYRFWQEYGASTMGESVGQAWRNSFGAPTTTCTNKCTGSTCIATCF